MFEPGSSAFAATGLSARRRPRWHCGCVHAPRWRSLDIQPRSPLPEGDWTRHIQVRAHELKTVSPAGPHRHVRTGFVGICCYRVERQAPASVALWLRACAALALYAGVGMGTARGMGQVTGEWGQS